MVRAILAGTKTQTRLVITDRNSRGNFRSSELLLDDPRTFSDPGPSPAGNPGHYLHAYVNAPLIEKRKGWKPGDCDPTIMERLYPLVFPGDRLWVRETWMDVSGTGVEARDPHTHERTRYAYGADTPAGSYADQCRKDYGLKWRPSIHMPRAASRITLEVTGVRVERLQDISEADAMAEGCDPYIPGEGIVPRPRFGDDYAYRPNYIEGYRQLWGSINGPGSWDANPWVWCVEFKRIGQSLGEGESKT